MRDLIDALLRHFAFASATLALALVFLEILIPGAVMPFLFIPGLVVFALILQFFVQKDSNSSVFEKIFSVTLALLLFAYILLILDLRGVTGWLLKASLISLLLGFAWSVIKSKKNTL